MLKVILVASGKGGTGKTSLTAGVGAALAANGHRVLVIDGDCGLRNLDIVLGMSDRVVYSFADVAGGAVPLADAMACHPCTKTLYLLTAPVALPALSERGMDQLAKQAEQAGFDYLIIDGPAGLPAELSFLAHIATQAIIVTSTDRVCARRGTLRPQASRRNTASSASVWCSTACARRIISRGRSATSTTQWMRQGFPLLGIVPEDVDLIACGNSGTSIIAAKKTRCCACLSEYRAPGRRARAADEDLIVTERQNLTLTQINHGDKEGDVWK